MSKGIWISLSLASMVVIAFFDWATGTAFSFFTFYFLPVSIAAWYVGFETSIAIAVVSVATWCSIEHILGHVSASLISDIWNIIVRLCALVIIGASITKIRNLLEKERNLTTQLHKAISDIKVLEGFLSICCECKKIRNEEGSWQQLEVYISQHSDTRFSHGYCPECFQKKLTEIGLESAL